jgi:phosphate/sulfate permease
MKTSTVIIVAVVALLYFQGSFTPRSTAPVAVAPPERPIQQQSGGGDTVNQVMALITASTLAFAQGVNLATDRGSQS